MLDHASKAGREEFGHAEEVEMTRLNHDTEQDPSSTAPLIKRSLDDQRNSSPISSSGANTFLYLLTLSACIGGLLFGYDTGVISATLVSINTDLSSRPLTSLDKGLITSSTSFFALIASPLAGILADRFGRKSVILASDLLFACGAIWQAMTSTVWGMIVGRGLVGLAIGGASLIVPLYIAELAPGHLRGRLTTIQLLLITGGQAVAYIIGYVFSTLPHGWRWMVGLGAAPAIMQMLLVSFMPETPRYLVKTNQDEKARQILRKVYNGTVSDLFRTADTVLAGIKTEVFEEEEARTNLKPAGSHTSSSTLLATLSSLLTHPPHLRALSIACLLQGFQQLCGFNVLMYFSGSIFQMLNFQDPILASLSVAITNFLFTMVAFFLIDRLGRRKSLLYTVPIMTGSLVICAVAFKFVHLPADLDAAPSPSANPGIDNSPRWATTLILLSLMAYVSSYATGLGPVPWQQSELFPLSVRSLGSSISTATNWGSNTIVGLTFLPMMQILTPSWTFAVYAGVCVVGWIAIWAIYPETSGMELEEISELFEQGWGVEKSMERMRNKHKLSHTNDDRS